jgi:hypothetical protein
MGRRDQKSGGKISMMDDGVAGSPRLRLEID